MDAASDRDYLIGSPPAKFAMLKRDVSYIKLSWTRGRAGAILQSSVTDAVSGWPSTIVSR